MCGMYKLPLLSMVVPPLPHVSIPVVVVSSKVNRPGRSPRDWRGVKLDNLHCGSLIVNSVDRMEFTSDLVVAVLSVTSIGGVVLFLLLLLLLTTRYSIYALCMILD